MANIDPANGYLMVNGIEWEDGTVQTSAAISAEPVFSGTVPTSTLQFTGTATPVLDGTPVLGPDFASSITIGGSYLFRATLTIGGNNSSFAMGALEQVVVMVRCQIESSTTGALGPKFGTSAVLPATFGSSTTLPQVTADTILTLPTPPTGDKYDTARYQLTISSNTASSTSTIGISAVEISVFTDPF